MGSKGRGIGAHLPSVPHPSAAAMLQDPIHGHTEQLINLRGVVSCGDGRFQAAINIFCNKVPLGVFDCPADAARAFDVAALALFDAAAVTNFPASSYGNSEVSTVRHALLHEHAKTQPTWDSPSGTEEAGTDETTHAVHPQLAAYAAQQQDQTDAKPRAQHQVQQHSQRMPLAGAAPVAAETPGGTKQQSKGVAPLHAQPVSFERKPKRHNSSPSTDIAAAGPQQHDQQHDQHQHAARVEPAAKRRKAAANAVEHARDGAEALAPAADQRQQQQQHKEAPTPDVRPAAGKHSQSPDQEQQQLSDGHFAFNAVPESTSAELTTPAAAEGAAQCAMIDIKPLSAAVGEAASLGSAADIAHAHPNMLTGLLCLIDAAASLSAGEQAELLQDTKLQQQQGASHTTLTARQPSRARTDRMQQQLEGLTEQQQQQQRGDSRSAVEAAVHAAPTASCSPAGVVSSAHGLAAAISSGQAAAAKARASKREPSTEHTSSDGSDCCSWDAAAAAGAAGTRTAGSTSPGSEAGGAAAAAAVASLRHSSRARKPTSRIMEFDMQTLIAQPQVRKKANTGQDPTNDEQQTKQEQQQQKLKQKQQQKQQQQQQQQQQKQQQLNKQKHSAAAKATAKAKRMQGISTAVAAVITKGSASKIATGPSVVKTQGPGCVSHAQNPTGQMGVRQRKGKYEAFVAVPPFRYLYLGQYETLQQAAVVRDTAMLAIFGKSAAADFGSAWLSAKGAKEISPEAVTAMAAKLYKKEHVAPVMVAHGTHQLVQQSDG